MELVAAIGRVGAFAGSVVVRLPHPAWRSSDLARHVLTVTGRCFGPVVAVTLPFGMVIALQGLEIFAIYGAERMLASLVCVAVLRELSPVLACVLVAAQGGSAFAAELGAMRVREELDATEIMAVDGIACHVVPRLLALVIACPILNIAGTAAGIAGALFTATVMKGERAGIFLAELWSFATPADVWGGVVKTLVFGLIIGCTATYLGFHASGGSAGVGRAVNQTVVRSAVCFVVANYFLTSALFGILG